MKQVAGKHRWGWRHRNILLTAVLLGLLVGYGIAVLSISLQPPDPKKAEELKPASCPPGVSIETPELEYQGHEGADVCQKGAAKGVRLEKTKELVSPVVVVAHNRVQYLAKAMLSLLTVWSQDPANQQKFPLFVSVDGEVQQTLLFATAWREAAGVQVITRAQNTALCSDAGCNLTGHYRMLLQLFLDCLRSPRLLFVEEDLEVAPDFFSYFEHTAPLLDKDSSLWCISAWNDHAQPGRAVNSTALYRTDIMPGLGWMINRRYGSKLAAKWPEREWDEWMRRADIRQGRQCVYPEMPRTHTFGKVGAHGGLYFEEILAIMVMNKESINWSKQDVSYLLKDKYADHMKGWLSAAKEFVGTNQTSLAEYCDIAKPIDTSDSSDLAVTYDTLGGNGTSFVRFAQELKPMMGGIVLGTAPKLSYDGIVVVRCRGRRVFLRPEPK